jgi:hypothetical protein
MFRQSNVSVLPALAIGLLAFRAPMRAWFNVIPLPVLGLAIIAAYDISLTGRMGGKFYHAPFLREVDKLLPNLAGFLFSPARGIFIYTPMLALSLGSLRSIRQMERWKLALCAVAWTFIILQCFVVSVRDCWWGSVCWGPRYFTDALPFAVSLLAIAWPHLRKPAWRCLLLLMVGWQVFLQVIGVFYFPNGYWNTQPVSIDLSTNRLWDWRDNPVRRTLSAGPMLAPYAIAWTAVSEGVPAAKQKLDLVRAGAAEARDLAGSYTK